MTSSARCSCAIAARYASGTRLPRSCKWRQKSAKYAQCMAPARTNWAGGSRSRARHRSSRPRPAGDELACVRAAGPDRRRARVRRGADDAREGDAVIRWIPQRSRSSQARATLPRQDVDVRQQRRRPPRRGARRLTIDRSTGASRRRGSKSEGDAGGAARRSDLRAVAGARPPAAPSRSYLPRPQCGEPAGVVRQEGRQWFACGEL